MCHGNDKRSYPITSPLLFTIHSTNTPPLCVWLSAHMASHNTAKIPSCTCHSHHGLGADISLRLRHTVSTWMKKRLLKLNLSKTKLLVIPINQPVKLSITTSTTKNASSSLTPSKVAGSWVSWWWPAVPLWPLVCLLVVPLCTVQHKTNQAIPNSVCHTTLGTGHGYFTQLQQYPPSWSPSMHSKTLIDGSERVSASGFWSP